MTIDPPAFFPDLALFINGAWTTGSEGKFLDVRNPATEAVIGRLPMAGEGDIANAIAAAATSFGPWRDMGPARRTSILLKAASFIRRDSRQLAALTTLELGLPIRDAQVLMERSADVLEWDANEGRRLYGRVLPSEPGLRQMVLREAIGPAAAFSPWNGSIFTPCRKIGSALSAGCTLVLKAAEETPVSTIALVRLFEEAGVPAGVLNLVFGNPAAISQQLIESPDIRIVSFTGSVPVGRQLAVLAARHLKPAVMELGGHAPVIVCADANVEIAAERLVATKFFSAGQVCFSPSRVYVERSVYHAFVDSVAGKVAQIKLGDGFDESTRMGPMVSSRRLEAVHALVQEAVEKGGEICHGGRRRAGPGFYYEPTVLTGVPPNASVLREEPFGPVMTIAPFDDLAHAIRDANGLPYGLAAYAFTQSAAIADRLSRELECGMVGINSFGVSTHGMPFGGVKDSGSGREGGIEGISSYTVAKTVTHAFI
jgi:succinate-semialdehyde dehydrogenase/glutarate-semialdehyde dehydrogenase